MNAQSHLTSRSVTPTEFFWARKVAFIATIALMLSGMPLVMHQKCPEPTALAGWSLDYLVLGVLTVPTLLLAALLAIYANTNVLNLYGFLGFKKYFVVLGASALTGFFVCVMLEGFFHAYALAIFSVILLVVALAGHHFGEGLVLPLYNSIAVGTALLFVGELPRLSETRTSSEQVVWGDDNLFQYLWPEKPPFLGVGGRLRPNVFFRLNTPSSYTKIIFQTESHGFRNSSEVLVKRKPDTIRVLSLGDSFSAGYAMDQKEFFGEVLRRELQTAFPDQTVEVLSAEVSDPAVALHYIQSFGDLFNPDLVVYGLWPTNDILQSHLEMGTPYSRWFLDDAGQLSLNQNRSRHRIKEFVTQLTSISPYRRPLLHVQHSTYFTAPRFFDFGLVAWLLDRVQPQRTLGAEIAQSFAKEQEEKTGYKQLYEMGAFLAMYQTSEPELLKLSYESLFSCLIAIRDYYRSRRVPFFVVYYPSRLVTQQIDWERSAIAWNLDNRDFDLGKPHDRIGSFAIRNDISWVDPTEQLKEAGANSALYFPNDVHLNAAGTAVVAKVTAQHISASRSLLPNSQLNK